MRILLPGALLIFSISTASAQCIQPFFSEYLEGSSNNKAVEIYNPGSTTLDLHDYKIYRYNNGSPVPSDSLFPQDVLAPGDVWVAGNPSAVAAILNESDTLHTITFFNGDDVLTLVHIPTNTVLDVIGEVGVDPGTNWPVGSGATSEFTLVRMVNINQGTTSWTQAATEYDVYPVNTLSFIGNHTMNPCCIAPTAFLVGTAHNDCFGDSSGAIQYTPLGTGPFTYEWINMPDTTASLSGLPAGTYTFVVTGACGTDTAITTITEPPLIDQAFMASADPFCNVNNGMLYITVTGGTPGYTYLWSNGDTTGTLNNLAAGIYTLTVTDANACTSVVSYTLTTTPAPVVAITGSTDPDCAMSNGSISASASGGTPGYDYSWSNGDTSATAANLPAGTYTVIVTDSAGCADTTVHSIQNPPAPVVTVSLAMDTVCGPPLGGPHALTGESPAGGVWSGNGVNGSTFYSDSVSYGFHIITYTYTDSLGCTGTAVDSILVDICGGITDVNSGSFDVAPNPFTNEIRLNFAHASGNVISIFNMHGQLVHQENTNAASVLISLEYLPAGMYLLRVSNGEEVMTKKIQKAE